jgi:hypothetical protein
MRKGLKKRFCSRAGVQEGFKKRFCPRAAMREGSKMKIDKTYNYNMRNDVHFQFHTEFRDLVEKHGAEELKIKPRMSARRHSSLRGCAGRQKPGES